MRVSASHDISPTVRRQQAIPADPPIQEEPAVSASRVGEQSVASDALSGRKSSVLNHEDCGSDAVSGANVARSGESMLFRMVERPIRLHEYLDLEALADLYSVSQALRDAVSDAPVRGFGIRLEAILGALTAFTGVSVRRAVAMLRANPAGRPGVSRLTSEQQRALIELIRTPAAGRTFDQLVAAGVVRTGFRMLTVQHGGHDVPCLAEWSADIALMWGSSIAEERALVLPQEFSVRVARDEMVYVYRYDAGREAALSHMGQGARVFPADGDGRLLWASVKVLPAQTLKILTSDDFVRDWLMCGFVPNADLGPLTECVNYRYSTVSDCEIEHYLGRSDFTGTEFRRVKVPSFALSDACLADVSMDNVELSGALRHPLFACVPPAAHLELLQKRGLGAEHYLDDAGRTFMRGPLVTGRSGDMSGPRHD